MTNIYETTIIVKPDLANDEMKNLTSSIDHFFTENGISIGYREDWGIKNLKFSIKKYSKGSFKFIRFNSNTDFPKKLDGFLKFNTDCLRFLITKSTNELNEITPQINKDN
ncbi:MAG: 30S ribosomal protein S6 [Alphaproteobacteria bacterium]